MEKREEKRGKNEMEKGGKKDGESESTGKRNRNGPVGASASAGSRPRPGINRSPSTQGPLSAHLSGPISEVWHLPIPHPLVNTAHVCPYIKKNTPLSTDISHFPHCPHSSTSVCSAMSMPMSMILSIRPS